MKNQPEANFLGMYDDQLPVGTLSKRNLKEFLMLQAEPHSGPCEEDAISVFSLSVVDSVIGFDINSIKLMATQRNHRGPVSVSSASTLPGITLHNIPETLPLINDDDTDSMHEQDAIS